MNSDVIIIGGGVAGLSAAIHCAELGLKPVLVESGSYPAHKICGEFFSPECLPLLARWGIVPPVLLKRLTISAGSRSFTLSLNSGAGSMSRYFFDHLLAGVAQSKGVVLLSNSRVTAICRKPNMKNYEVVLANGNVLTSSRLIIGTGRVTQLLEPDYEHKPMTFPYVGIKAHFKGPKSDEVRFYTFSSGYLGVSSIEDGKVNVACLARKEVVEKHKSTKDFMMHLSNLPGMEPLKDIFKQSVFDWMSCAVPDFGIKHNHPLPNVFFIGDAAGVIPPASGDGLAIALTSGALVAPFVLARDAPGFRVAWKQQYGSVIRYGKLLHQIMMRPPMVGVALMGCKIAPGLANYLFYKTRCKKF